jgi:hypothetical protein
MKLSPIPSNATSTGNASGFGSRRPRAGVRADLLGPAPERRRRWHGLVLLGIGFGESGYALLKTIPNAVLGSLLLFSGLELALSSKPQEYRDADLFLVLLMAAIGVALNPAAAFAVGLPLAYAFKQKWLRI